MHRRILAVTLCASVLLSACSDDSATSICEPAERQEPQFPQGHVLPGAPEPAYLSEPPTSGPHIAVGTTIEVFDEPLARPAQVGVLERGVVLLQYRDDVDRTAAEALAGDGVVVAPNPDLDSPVVLTAWLVLQRCPALDADSVAAFSAAHGDRTGDQHS